MPSLILMHQSKNWFLVGFGLSFFYIVLNADIGVVVKMFSFKSSCRYLSTGHIHFFFTFLKLLFCLNQGTDPDFLTSVTPKIKANLLSIDDSD